MRFIVPVTVEVDPVTWGQANGHATTGAAGEAFEALLRRECGNGVLADAVAEALKVDQFNTGTVEFDDPTPV